MISKNPYSAPIEISLENEAREYRSLVVNKINKIIYYRGKNKTYKTTFSQTAKNHILTPQSRLLQKVQNL